MRKIAVCAALLVLASSVLDAQQNRLPEWQEGYLDIHCIATRCGDASFLVLPDGTTMLIDAGDMTKSSWDCHAVPDDSKSPAQWIVDYMETFAPQVAKTKGVDYMLLTHFHADHMGCKGAMKPGKYGTKVAGLSEVGDYVHFGKIVDRGYPSYDFPSKEKVESFNKGAMEPYHQFVDRQVSEGSKAEKFAVGSHSQFVLKYAPKKYDCDIWNIAANCERASAKGRKTVKMTSEGDDPMKFDENMFSCAVRLRYGSFSYFNGGDLSGNNYGPAKYPEFNRDYESQIAPLVGHVNVLKANHHGWKDTCNPYFMWTLAPDAVIVLASHIRHPWWETARRLVDPQLPGKRELYMTSDSGRELLGEELHKAFHPIGHIVVRVSPGGEKYKIYVLDAESRSRTIIESSDFISCGD